MKKLVVLLSVLLLAGCLESVPVKRNFPSVPEDLKVACPDLATIQEGTTKLSEVVKVVTDNYTQYHECRMKVDSWIEWYNTQKKIFEDAN